VKTLTGRIRHLPEMNSTDSSKRATAERQAVNSVIQGTASDIMKFSMVVMNKMLLSLISTSSASVSADNNEESPERIRVLLNSLPEEKKKLLSTSKLLMQIHDELIFEIPDDKEILPVFLVIIDEMMGKEVTKRFNFQIPLKTNISIGKEWGNMIPFTTCDKDTDVVPSIFSSVGEVSSAVYDMTDLTETNLEEEVGENDIIDIVISDNEEDDDYFQHR
jgi:DNA polymerase I-like protein with 3'-5' exonuclease and polymerase domains